MENNTYEIIYPFEISKKLYETQDRDIFFESKEFKNYLFNNVEKILNNSKKAIISCDIFDTILLRNEKSEPYRFFEIACEINEKLNLGLNNYEILLARYLGTEITYSASTIKEGCREGSLLDIHKIMTNVLGLSEKFLEKTIQIEIEYEKKNLRLNHGLWNFIKNMKKEINLDIIFISDMYKHYEQLNVLVKHFIPDYKDYVKVFYSSADTIISKHSGKIFKFVEQELNCKSEQFIHIGDNLRSDYQNPKKNGWNAVFLPIPKYVQEKIRENLISFKKQLDENNIRIDLVDRYFVN